MKVGCSSDHVGEESEVLQYRELLERFQLRAVGTREHTITRDMLGKVESEMLGEEASRCHAEKDRNCWAKIRCVLRPRFSC